MGSCQKETCPFTVYVSTAQISLGVVVRLVALSLAAQLAPQEKTPASSSPSASEADPLGLVGLLTVLLRFLFIRPFASCETRNSTTFGTRKATHNSCARVSIGRSCCASYQNVLRVVWESFRKRSAKLSPKAHESRALARAVNRTMLALRISSGRIWRGSCMMPLATELQPRWMRKHPRSESVIDDCR